MRKIKLTETQYKRLESSIMERSIRDAKKDAKKAIKKANTGNLPKETPTPNNQLNNQGSQEDKNSLNNDDKTSEQENIEIKLSDIILNIIKTVKKDKNYKFIFSDGYNITFICTGVQGGSFTFELYEPVTGRLKALNDWDSFNLNLKIGGGTEANEDLYRLNKDKIKSSSDGNSYGLYFNINNGSETKGAWLNGITNIIIVNEEPEKTDNTNNTDTNTDNTDNNPDNIKQSKSDRVKEVRKMMDIILNDPTMKAAFYKEPNLLDAVDSFLHGKNPRALGIVPAFDILSRYKTSQIKGKIGENGEAFNDKSPAHLIVVGKPIIITNPETGDVVLQMNVGDKYIANVQKYSLGEDRLVLKSSKNGFSIIINKEVIGLSDTFDVTIIKEIKKINAPVEEFKGNGRVKFLSIKGSGYYVNPTTNATQKK